MAMDSPVMLVTVVTEDSWPAQMVDDVAGLRMGCADAGDWRKERGLWKG
jgi:hypothetical protein